MTEIKEKKQTTEQDAISRYIEEVPLSRQKAQEIEKGLHPEQTRQRLIRWMGAVCLSTVLISGGLTAGAAFLPNKVNEAPIRDWTHSMVTAQVGIISAVFGYYFGSRSQNSKKDEK